MNDLSISRRLGELMRSTTPPHSRQEHLEGRARLIASVERIHGRAGRRAIAGLAVALAAAVAIVVAQCWPPRSVAWHVVDGTVEATGYVRVAATGPSARLVFDDGSDVSLAPGSRGRVGATSRLGAEVVLEQGRATIHVQHRAHSAWTVEAGPYAVHVTGTDFVVAWAADPETLELWMRTGRVVVTGPVPGDDVTLSTGEHLIAKLGDRTFQIDGSPEPSGPATPTRPDVTQGSASGAGPLASAGDATSARHGTDPASPFGTRAVVSETSWSKSVTAGEYARVLHEAEGEGIVRAIASRPLADLRSLGDAARYTGRVDVAKRAYTTIRERFSSSPEALTAAFLLGRIAEEQQHASGEAVRWYDTYFAEAPTGTFAGDALGRKMILVSSAQGRDAARALAQRYLERFPSGPYAAAARELTP
jgi:hypothetical protein